jgi:N4-gp56 family major capsid protein
MSGAVWAVSSIGGYMHAENLSKKLRYELFKTGRFRQFCDVRDGQAPGRKKGDVFHWDVYSKVENQGTTVVETNTMPETQFTVTQGTLTVTEAGNSVPYSGKLDDLSEHDVTDVINKVLKEDANLALESLAVTQFNSCVHRVCGSTVTTITSYTDGTCTNTNSNSIRKAHVGLILDYMKELNIPPYKGSDYYCIAWPSTFRTFHDEMTAIFQYTTEGLGQIRVGEIGKYENVRFIEQTAVAKGGAADSTTWTPFVSDAWNGGYSDWAYFFGADTVVEAIARDVEIRAKIPTDYGRSKGIAWYYLGGFGIVHTSATNCRIVKWDSAV